MDKNKAISMLNSSIDSGTWTIGTTGNYTDEGTYKTEEITCWNYWQTYYYPYIIKESYPVYIQEKAIDKGKKAYEIVKVLRDKKLVQVRTVKQFIDLMNELIKLI